MTALLEYECHVSVDGYEIITTETERLGTRLALQPRSERNRRFDLFKVSSSAYLEFAQTPTTPDAIKDFADRYGLLFPDSDYGTSQFRWGRDISVWSDFIEGMKWRVEIWTMSRTTGDFRKLLRTVRKKPAPAEIPGLAVSVELRLQEDPLSGSARLCICPDNLYGALQSQLFLAIDGNVNLGACVQCRKWFALEAGQGRSDKQYCSNACRMRAYRKRKTSG